MTVAELMVATIIILLVSAGMVTAIRQATENYSKSMAQSEAKKLCSSLETLVENELRYTNVVAYEPAYTDGKWYYRSKNYQSTETDCDDLQSFAAVTADWTDTEYGIVTVRSTKRSSTATRDVRVLSDGMYPHNIKAKVEILGYSAGLFNVRVTVKDKDGANLAEDVFTVKNLYYTEPSAGGTPTEYTVRLYIVPDLYTDAVKTVNETELLSKGWRVVTQGSVYETSIPALEDFVTLPDLSYSAEFTGLEWEDDAGASFAPLSLPTIHRENTTFTAVLTPNNHRLIFKASDATEVLADLEVRYGTAGSAISSVPSPKISLPTGDEEEKAEFYTFDGWDDSFGTVYNQSLSGFTMPDHDTILTAKYTRKTRTITFKPSGGGIATDPDGNAIAEADRLHDIVSTQDVGRRLKIPSTPYWPDSSDNKNHTFDGWYNGSDKLDTANLPIVPDANVTYTAHWKVTATVTYELDGGSMPAGRFATETVENPPKNITLPTPTRQDYIFKGWEDVNGTVRDAGATVTITENTTFTARWARTYRIKILNGNNNQAEGILSPEGVVTWNGQPTTAINSWFHEGDQGLAANRRVWQLDGFYDLSAKDTKVLNANLTLATGVTGQTLLNLAQAQGTGELRLYAKWTNKAPVYTPVTQFEEGYNYLIMYPYQSDRSKALTVSGGNVASAVVQPRTGKMYYNNGNLAGESYVLNKETNGATWLTVHSPDIVFWASGLLLYKNDLSGSNNYLNMYDDGRLELDRKTRARWMTYENGYTIGRWTGDPLYLNYIGNEDGAFRASENAGVKTTIYRSNAAGTIYSFNGAE